jgi:hypothetical protein
MGVGYSKELVQWSSGQYLSADNQQDDLTIITTTNGFGYRADDYGSTISTANEPPLKSEIPLSLTGVIEQNTDIDLFRIRTTGSLKATLTPAVPQSRYPCRNLGCKRIGHLYEQSSRCPQRFV